MYRGSYPSNNTSNGSFRGRPSMNTNSYRGNHSYSGGGYNNYPPQQNSETSSEFWCDVCDRGFPNPYSLQKHISEHQTCNIDGCKYVAHPNAITKHIQMQHSTGLYNKIRSLNTPDDIEKWRNDRKRKYPSKENVQKRQRINEEKQARGEKLTNKSIRGSFRGRGGSTSVPRANHNQRGAFKKRNRSRKTHTIQKPKHLNIEVISEINKDDWNGDLPPFPGTKNLFGTDQSEHESCTDSDDEINCIDDDFEDDEWEQQNNTTVDIPIKNALGLLMNNYGSSDEDDNDVQRPQVEVKDMTCVVHKSESESKQLTKDSIAYVETKEDNLDDEPPDEIIAIKNEPEIDLENIIDNTKKPRVEQKNQIDKKKNYNERAKTSTHQQYKKFRRQETLLEKLLRNEIRHERNILLQCVRHIINNNFFGLGKNIENAEGNIIPESHPCDKVELKDAVE